MDTSKIIKGVVGGGRYTVTAPIIKEDYGLYLKIEGIELPETYEVDFSNDEHSGSSVTMIGNSDGVLIPSQFISTGKDIFAFLYHVGVDFGRTLYKFRIPNKLRPDRTDEEPTPEEQSTIDQAISALNTAVEQTAQDVIDADASAQSASQSAENAHDSAVDAQNYAESASGYASDAQGYATTASQKATEAGNSADQAAQIKTDIEGYVSTAQGYAQTATDKAAQASQSATNASNSATTASTKAGEASASATTASNKASEASGYANTASQKASDASDSASAALGYKTDAESAKTASQTAQGKAEDAQTAAETAQGLAEDAQEAAESAAASIQSSASQIAQNTADIADLQTDVAQNEADILKAFPTDTASGAVASFTDGADGLPLKSLVVDINPVQDLHGYDSPWPAGGGKNGLLPVASNHSSTLNGITITYNSDTEAFDLNGTNTKTDSAWILFNSSTYTLRPLSSETTYYFSHNLPSGTYGQITYNKIGGGVSVLAYIKGNGSFNKVSFTLPANFDSVAKVQIGVDASVGTISASGIHYGVYAENPTAWSPYENICPISGWTEVDVEQRGVNIFDKATAVQDAYIDDGNGVEKVGTGSVCSDYIPVVPNATYYIKSDQTMGAWGAWYDKDKNFISGIIGYIATAQDSAKTKTAPSNARYMRLTIVRSGTGNLDTFSVNYPSTDHSYHSYTGRSITINLGQTVYGGKLDVLTGELVVDRAYALLNDPDKWRASTGTTDFIYIVGFPNRKKYDNSYTGLSCSYMTVNTNQQNTQTARWTGATSDSFGLRWVDGTLEQVKTDSAAGKIEICYELATPYEIQLTPHEVNSLLGVNNIFADTGDTACEYRADPDLYIQRKMPEVPVDDVQINGSSIVVDGVADIPIGNYNSFGVFKLTGNSNLGGLGITNGQVYVDRATDALIKDGTNRFRPITPDKQHMSTFYALAKAASDTTQSHSSNAVGSYTEDAKSAISEMLGGSVTVSGTTPTIVAKSGIRYVCGEVATLDFTPCATGICDVVFTSGAVATVLTVPSTIKWANGFDPTALDANTTYELNIMDGLGVAGAWT